MPLAIIIYMRFVQQSAFMENVAISVSLSIFI